MKNNNVLSIWFEHIDNNMPSLFNIVYEGCLFYSRNQVLIAFFNQISHSKAIYHFDCNFWLKKGVFNIKIMKFSCKYYNLDFFCGFWVCLNEEPNSIRPNSIRPNSNFYDKVLLSKIKSWMQFSAHIFRLFNSPSKCLLWRMVKLISILRFNNDHECFVFYAL